MERAKRFEEIVRGMKYVTYHPEKFTSFVSLFKSAERMQQVFKLLTLVNFRSLTYLSPLK